MVHTTLLKEQDFADLLQDVFLKVWERKIMLPAVDCFESYLFATARNELLNSKRNYLIKKQALRNYAGLQKTDYNDTEEHVIYKCLQMTVYRAIQTTLPEKCRQVFHLYLIHGLSQKQIARELGITTQAVGRHIHKAQAAIGDYLHQHDITLVTWATILTIFSLVELYK